MPKNLLNSCRLGRRPEKQGPRSQPSNRGWAEKSATERKIKIARTMLSVGTWNVRTLREAGKLQLLQEEMKRYRCDILGIAEMRWTKAGEMEGGKILWSGDESRHEAGVGFLLGNRARNALMGYKPVSDRILAARFRAQPYNITVIQVYAPTAASTEEDLEDFYNNLTETVEEVPKQEILIVMGDWNAKIGTENSRWEKVMGKFGYGVRNERGEKLLEFATDQNLLICNTRFQQKDCRKWTWRSNDQKTKNLIDFIMIDTRWATAVQQCRTFQGADIDSDHSLVIANIKIKLKRRHKGDHKAQRDLTRLGEEGTRIAYQQAIKERLETQEGTWSIEERTRQLTRARLEEVEQMIQLQEKIKKKWITKETMRLVEEKRELKKRRDISEDDERTYRTKSNEVRKAARKDKAQWLENQCRDIERYQGEGKTREMYKLIRNVNRKWKPKLTAIKNEEGRTLMNKEDIVQRWTTYCSELYKEQLDENTAEEVVAELKDITPMGEEREEEILEEEVIRAINRLKNNKSPGNDEITGEMIKGGGEIVAKELHKIINEVWKEGRTPEEWKKSILVILHKKGNTIECGNYRTIALISHLSKVLMMVLTERLKGQSEEYMTEEQAGFRRDRSTTQHLLALRLIGEKARRKNIKIFNCFVDFSKAFDSIDQNITWAAIDSYGVDTTAKGNKW